MKEFFSNAWVVSIISGIIVFILTNALIMLQNRRKHKKQIIDANLMVLNCLRGYVVDNGLPENEIIEAIKHSVMRKYHVKYENIFSTISLYEELITDIIGNIYISNENKIKYINMLQDYLKQNNKIKNISTKDADLQDKYEEIEIKVKDNLRNYKNDNNESNYKYELIISIIPTIITIISIYISFVIKQTKDIGIENIYMFLTLFIFSLISIIEWSNKK